MAKKKNQSADFSPESADFVKVEPKQSKRIRMLVLLGVLLAVICVGVFVGAPSRLLNSLARTALAKFDFDRAEGWLKFANHYLPKDAERELLWARIARKRSDYVSMDRHLSKAHLLGGDTMSIQMEEAMAAAQGGALELVEVQLNKWLEAGVGDTDEISDAYANGLAANSRFENLYQVLDAWQADFPEDPRPNYRRGRILEYQQGWEEAEGEYKKSLERNPGFFPSRYRLGRVLMLQRKMEEAREQFEICLDMSRPEAAKTSLAICYRSLVMTEKARELLIDVLQSDEEEIEQSYKSLEETMEFFEAASQLGDMESEAGNNESAEKWLRMALKRNRRDWQSRFSLAVTLRQMGRMEEAQIEFDAVAKGRKALEEVNPLRYQITENPKDPALRVRLGEILLNYEAEKNGLFWINSAFSVEPGYRPAHAALAKYYADKAVSDSMFQNLAAFHANAAQEPRP